MGWRFSGRTAWCGWRSEIELKLLQEQLETERKIVSRKQREAEKQFELKQQKRKEKHKLEIDKLQLEHKHQLELQQKQFENQLGGDMMNTLISEAMKMPEVKKQISQGMNTASNKRR